MLRIAVLAVGAWFVVGLVVALAVGRAGRRSGLESIALPQPRMHVAPVAAPRVEDELAVRRARRASIAVRVAAVAAAVGILGAVGTTGGVTSFGQKPASNVKTPAVADEQVPARVPARSSVVTIETRHPAERLSRPGHAHAQDAPGHDPAGPGRSEDAPGHDPAGPGRSEDAPGHDPAGPARSEDAPGHHPAGPGRSEVATGSETPAAANANADGAGRSDEAPGRAEDGPGTPER